MGEDERILDVNQAAAKLGVSPDTVRRYIEARLLPNAWDIGTRRKRFWRIPESDLDLIHPLRMEGIEFPHDVDELGDDLE